MRVSHCVDMLMVAHAIVKAETGVSQFIRVNPCDDGLHDAKITKNSYGVGS